MTARNPDGTEDFPSPAAPTSPTAGPMTQIFARHQPAKGVPVRSGPGKPVLLMPVP
jgi:hypothetical protein